MGPDVVRRDRVVGRQIFGSFAGGSDLEAAATGPIDQLAYQSGLIAIGQRIDHARRPRLFGEKRPGQHIGFDIHHDDVLFRANRRPSMGDARCRHPGRFDDDLDFVICARLGTRCCEHGPRDPRGVPAHGSASGARPLRVEISNDRDLDSRHLRHLRQKHRAELPGADQPHLYRPARGSPLLRQAMEIHDDPTRPRPCIPVRSRATRCPPPARSE